MERRTAIKQLLIVAGGLVLVPSCMGGPEKPSIDLANLDLSAADENLLAAIAEAIIPETDTPGAKTLNLHLFVMKMLDDCHSEADQQVFVDGLKAWDGMAKQALGVPFGEASETQQLEFVDAVNQDSDHALAGFFGIAKRRTIQGYLNSKYVMTSELVYELVPGRYNGYAPA